MPYTYLLTHIPSGLRYYGARWAKDSTPSDLWDTYFTSSKEVHLLIEKDGKDSFSFEIRKTFDTIDECRNWERKVLVRLRVRKNDRWINRGYGTVSPFEGPHTPSSKDKMRESAKRRGISPETREKINAKLIAFNKTGFRKGKTRSFSDEHRRNLSNAQKRKPPVSDETRAKLSFAHKGRKISEETKKKMSEAKKLYWEAKRAT